MAGSILHAVHTRWDSFWSEVWLQLCILFSDGWSEWKLYRYERDLDSTIWAPSKGRWVRARVVFRGFKYYQIRFVDGDKKTGKRSPLSIRPRDPRLRGADKPWVDARYSGNRPVPYRVGVTHAERIEALATFLRARRKLTTLSAGQSRSGS